MELVSIVKSTDGKHKLVATFENTKTGRTRKTKFGALGYKDYTTFPESERDQRRKNYRLRHVKDNLTDPTSPGALSWYILWGATPSLKTNIENYVNYFGL